MSNSEMFDNTGLTGENFFENRKYVEYPFEQYIIKVELDTNNKFIGIVEVKMNKSFFNYKTRNLKVFKDIEDFYKEEE